MVASATPRHAWPANPYADTEREARTLRTYQWLSIVSGIASVGFGVALLVWPGRTPAVVATLIGAWLLVAGLLRLVEAARVAAGVVGDAAGAARALAAVAGLFYLIGGLACLRYLPTPAHPLAIVVGIAWFAGGVAEIMSAVTAGRAGWTRLGPVTQGGVGVFSGLALAFWPQLPLGAAVLAASVALIVNGVTQAAVAARAARPIA
jgi:uncharacterized membrane protein HdeD (DUF308 family)